MASYSFYYYKEIDYHLGLVSLVENIVLKKGLKIRLLCEEGEEKEIDDVLWSKKQLSFVPHGLERDDLFETPVLISVNESGENFAQDVTLSLVPKELKRSDKKLMYLVKHQDFDSFKNLFNKFENAGNECNFHIFSGGKWSTEARIS